LISPMKRPSCPWTRRPEDLNDHDPLAVCPFCVIFVMVYVPRHGHLCLAEGKAGCSIQYQSHLTSRQTPATGSRAWKTVLANLGFFVQDRAEGPYYNTTHLSTRVSLPNFHQISICGQMIPSTSREQLAEYHKHVWPVSGEPMRRSEQSET
jgi:hypothetical protein